MPLARHVAARSADAKAADKRFGGEGIALLGSEPLAGPTDAHKEMTVAPLAADPADASSVTSALLARLRLRRSFYSALQFMVRDTPGQRHANRR